MLQKEIEGKKAEELVKKCPVGVFDLEDIGNGKLNCQIFYNRVVTMKRICTDSMLLWLWAVL